MAGNVWEWVHDWFDPSYYITSPYLNPRGPCDGALTCATTSTRVARGGSWDDAIPAQWEEDARHQNRLTTYFRHSEANEGCNGDVGFRCAMDFLGE
jgi:formylglycine-generating enzyme required for sulfatase activity